MKDFGNDAYSGDCFDIVGKIKGLDCNNSKDFVEILEAINSDLSLGIYENKQAFISNLMSDKTTKQPENLPDINPKKTKPYFFRAAEFFDKRNGFFGNNTALRPKR